MKSTPWTLLSTIAACLACTCAWAQEQSLSEVVVTATKVAQPLQHAPAAIDVLNANRLQAAGVTDIRAVQFMVPSVRLNKQQSVTQMFIRGVGIATDAPGLDMGVAMTFNGIEQFREATGTSLFDLDRVEVLRGPQATTYGSNSAGGVIDVVFAKPKNNFDGNASLEVGNYDLVHADAAQNFALGSRTQMRIALDSIDHNGYASNGLDDQKSRAGRVTFTANPTDNMDFTLWTSYYHAGGIGDIGYASPFVNQDDPWKQTWNPNALVTHFPGQAGRDRDVDLYEAGGEFNWTLGGVRLTYIPGYANLDHLGHLVIDTGRARILFQGKVRRGQTTQELRLSNATPGGKLQWLTGFYYYKLDTSEFRTVATNISFNIYHQPSQAIAGYGQITYSVTDPLRFTLGVRYSNYQKSALGDRYTPGLTPTPISFTADFSWNHVDWKVGTEYDLTPRSMLYAAVQTGYLGGGINFFNAPNTSNEVQPEELTAFILGNKNTFLNSRLRLNWEAFYYNWKNYQVGLFNVPAATNIVFNAPKSEAYGFEPDLQYLLTRNDQVELGVGLFRGRFINFIVPAGVSSPVRTYDFDGFDVPFAPKVSASLAYEHHFDLRNGSGVVASTQVQYSSSFWTSFSHGITRCSAVLPTTLSQSACVDSGVLQPASVMLNLDLTWHSPDDRWTISLWTRNLANEAIRTSGGDGGLSPAGQVTSLAASTLAPPRTYGARFGANW